VKDVDHLGLEHVKGHAIGRVEGGEKPENLIARVFLILLTGVQAIEQHHGHAAIRALGESIAVDARLSRGRGPNFRRPRRGRTRLHHEHLELLFLTVLEDLEIGGREIGDWRAVAPMHEHAGFDEADAGPERRRLLRRVGRAGHGQHAEKDEAPRR
jgi:hypothetical protein